MKELLEKYLNKEITAIHTIRTLSGIVNPDYAIDILVIVCQITRMEEGDLDADTFRAMLGLDKEG